MPTIVRSGPWTPLGPPRGCQGHKNLGIVSSLPEYIKRNWIEIWEARTGTCTLMLCADVPSGNLIDCATTPTRKSPFLFLSPHWQLPFYFLHLSRPIQYLSFYFTWSNVIKFYSCCNMYQFLFPFQSWIIFQHMCACVCVCLCISHFV